MARLLRPLDDAVSAEFVATLEPISALAEASKGFVWRLKDEEGQSSTYVTIDEIADPLLIINYSIWEDHESLKHFVYASGHGSYLRRRTEWFDRPTQATTVCWWIPAGSIPPVEEGYSRLLQMRENGPSVEGWSLTRPWDPELPQ